MSTIFMQAISGLWMNALAATPLALAAYVACRCLPTRPSTRHLIWLIVLLRFLSPSLTSPWASAPATPEAHEPRTTLIESESVRSEGSVDPVAPMNGSSKAANAVDDVDAITGLHGVEAALADSWNERVDADAERLESRFSRELEGNPVAGVWGESESASLTEENQPSMRTDASAPLQRFIEWTPAGPSATDPLAPAPVPGGGLPSSITFVPVVEGANEGANEGASDRAPNRASDLSDARFESMSAAPSVPLGGADDDRRGASAPGSFALFVANELCHALTTSPATAQPLGEESGGGHSPAVSVGPRSTGGDEASLTPPSTCATRAEDGAGGRGNDRGLASPWRRAAAWSPTLARMGWLTMAGEAESVAAAMRASLAPWLEQLSRIRDAAYALPPMPWVIWVGGALLAWALICGRWVWGVGVVRSSRPAPGTLRREVARLARRLGMRRWPTVRVTDRAVSPMVVCAPRCTILLPAPLWRELDPVARQAVILHELAHLKRRDHWVLLIESVVSMLYWWNPVAWWVRRRLQDEAELCCDAWVMCLMPKNRRVYAEVLLTTRRMVQSQEASMPTVGMTMTSGRASRLARRIKMIMTERARPRLSVPGCALGLALACGAWMTAPAAVCPPDECKAMTAAASKTTTTTVVASPSTPPTVTYVTTPAGQGAVTAYSTAAPKGMVVVTSPDGLSKLQAETIVLTPSVPSAPMAGAAPRGAVSAPALMALGGAQATTSAPVATQHSPHPPAQAGPMVAQNTTPAPTALYYKSSGPGGDPMNDRLRRLEEQMQRLERQLAELNAALGQREKMSHDFLGRVLATTQAEKVAQDASVRELVERVAEQTHRADGAQAHAEAAAKELAERERYQEAMAKAQAGEASSAEAMAKYQDALAKAELFAAQSARSQPAAPPTPMAESRFAPPGAEVIRSYALPQGKLDALLKLMLRDDVPVRVRQDGDKIEVHGTEQQHAVVAAFIAMIGDPEEITRDYKLPDGKLKALCDLMVRDDVPIMVNPGSDAITVHGSAAEQAVFQAFIDLIHPRGPQVRDSANLAPVPAQPRQPQMRGSSGGGGAGGRAGGAVGGGRASIDVTVPGGAAIAGPGGGVTIYSNDDDADTEIVPEPSLDPIGAADAQRGAIESRLREVQSKAREIEREAKSRERQAADLQREADRITDQADDLKGDAQMAARDKAREIERRARDLEGSAEDLHTQAEKLQEEAEALQEKVLAAREQSRTSKDRPRATR